jgi:hypothetical protein
MSQQEAPRQEPVCQSHCNQGELSSDIAQVPPVLPLPAMAMFPLATLASTPAAATLLPSSAEAPPPLSWHRPTAHPAALLLI